MNKAASGTLYGIGVGPGDPELITLKAVRILQKVPVIAYPITQGKTQARYIASQWLIGKREIPVNMPCISDRNLVNRCYDISAKLISRELTSGHDVAMLCEGDPLLYGSFSYLLYRLSSLFTCVVIPGITAINAAAAAISTPLITGIQKLTVIPATASTNALRQALLYSESVAVLKLGRHLTKVMTLVQETQRTEDAFYIEYASRSMERIFKITEMPMTTSPYFALLLVISKFSTGAM